MAHGTIVTGTLGTMQSQKEGTFVVIIRGKQPKHFAKREDAQAYLEKHGEKRYHTVIRINGKQHWKMFERKKDAEDYFDRNSTDVRDGTYREIKKATFGQYIEQWKAIYLIVGTIDENGSLTAKRLKPSTIRPLSFSSHRNITASGPWTCR